MRFLYKKFQGKRKEILRVEMDAKTKVKFMTAQEFKLYEKGKTHRYYGGTFDPGEVFFVLPFDSVWHAVVERGSYFNPMQLQASCSLLGPDSNQLSTVALDAPEDIKGIVDHGATEALDDITEELSEDMKEVVEKGEDLIGDE